MALLPFSLALAKQIVYYTRISAWSLRRAIRQEVSCGFKILVSTSTSSIMQDRYVTKVSWISPLLFILYCYYLAVFTFPYCIPLHIYLSGINQSCFYFSFMALGPFLRRNVVSIAFPTFAVSCIFLDWNHTRKWKKHQKELWQSSESQLGSSGSVSHWLVSL